jgi:acetaldehyde dehydrogenase
MMDKVKCAIIGPGNIGTDLMIKVMRTSDILDVAAMVGIDPESDGLARAKKLGVATTHAGMDGLVKMPAWKDIQVVFDATSAKAHEYHNELCKRAGKRMVDLTPAAIGPYCIPVVNADEHLDKQNVNMVTCGGQATIPIVHAVRRVSESVPYAEIVASVASKSAGPGTRANIDEFTETTAKGVEVLGGAEHGKAIIILNPAEPPLIMRDTVYAFSVGGEEKKIEKSIEDMVAAVKQYVPGYRLKQKVQFEHFGCNRKLKIPGIGEYEGIKVTVFLEVEGAAHYLPAYAGNLDIMTSAGLAIGERMVKQKVEAVA